MPKARQTLAQITALLAEQKAPASGGTQSLGFPFWLQPAGTTSIVRLLPSWDEEVHPLPWIDKWTITLPFAGIVGGPYATDEPATVKVPALKSWGQKDYIIEATRSLWNGSDDEKAVARTYYHRPSYIFNALIVSTPIVETGTADSPIRRLHLNKSLYERVYLGLTDSEYEYGPWDQDEGRDFKIVKSTKGSWADYSQSSFGYKPRPLSEAERQVIEKHGIPDLTAELGEMPDATSQAVIKEMFAASLAGEAFDTVRWPTFKAYSKGGRNGGPSLVAKDTGNGESAESRERAADLISGLRVKARVG